MKKINAIVIDDEASSRQLISSLIKEMNQNFEITGEADGINTGYELIKNNKPDVLFLDIRMRDGNGFDLLAKIDTVDFDVVFVSGFDSYALKAFEFNALDYILKPIDPLKLEKALKKIETNFMSKIPPLIDYNKLANAYDRDQMIISRIPVHSGNKVVLVDVKEIAFLRWENNFTIIKTINNEKYYSSKQLSDFEFIIEQLSFLVRANRNSFINLNFIKGYTKGTQCIISLKDGSEFEVSRRKKAEILELMAGKNDLIE